VENDPIIVIVEDDENDARLLELAFRAIGRKTHVRMVEQGDAAIEYLSGSGKYEDRAAFPFPNVLFLDLKMPKVSGFDVLRWLKEHPDCGVMPTMVFSGSNIADDVKLAYELGANGYLRKPETFEDLKAMLRSTLEFWKWCCKPDPAKERSRQHVGGEPTGASQSVAISSATRD
jgi:CheY-like chemotaxis protein